MKDFCSVDVLEGNIPADRGKKRKKERKSTNQHTVCKM
jgi:hypothetical protein